MNAIVGVWDGHTCGQYGNVPDTAIRTAAAPSEGRPGCRLGPVRRRGASSGRPQSGVQVDVLTGIVAWRPRARSSVSWPAVSA